MDPEVITMAPEGIKMVPEGINIGTLCNVWLKLVGGISYLDDKKHAR